MFVVQYGVLRRRDASCGSRVEMNGCLQPDSTKLKHSRLSSNPAKQGPNRRLAFVDFPFTVGSYEGREAVFFLKTR